MEESIESEGLDRILELLSGLTDDEIRLLLFRLMAEGRRRDFGVYWWE